MGLNVRTLFESPRLLVEARLHPIQGERFQPTGFPDLGPARYTLSDGTEMLLVESAQSVANRLEAVCWDEANNEVLPGLAGLPYVRIELGPHGQTTTIQEFHRLNSPYLWGGEGDARREAFQAALRTALNLPAARKEKGAKGKAPRPGAAAPPEGGPVDGAPAEGGAPTDTGGTLDLRALARVAFRFDPGSVLHGVFLEKLAGRLRLARALTGFIEARNVRVVEAGGVKFDRVFPDKNVELGITANDGYTNVPFHRTEFTAREIVAFFNVDLALIRGYGLHEAAAELLVALALFKVRAFLARGLRLRTACDLAVVGPPVVVAPAGFALPEETELLATCSAAIARCRETGLFPEPPVTVVSWLGTKAKAKKAEAAVPAAPTASVE